VLSGWGLPNFASNCRIGRSRLDGYIAQMSQTFQIVCGILVFVALVIAMQYIPTPTEDKK